MKIIVNIAYFLKTVVLSSKYNVNNYFKNEKTCGHLENSSF